MSDQEQTGVNPLYSKYDNMTPVELVKAMAAIRITKDDLDEQAKVVGAEFDFLRLVKIPAKFEEQEITLLKVEGIGRCNLTGDLQVSVIPGAKEALFQFMRDTGRGDLIKEEINASTLKATVKGMMQKGEEVPEQLRVHAFTRASITKA